MLVGLAGGMAILYAGWLLYVETDKGQIVIECPTDDIQLSVTRDGQPVGTEQLKAGANQLELRSGTYRLAIAGDVRNFRLEPQEFKLSRGAEQTGEVVSVASGLGSTTESKSNSHTPLFNGKTFDQWLHVLETERNSEERARAIGALAQLADVRGAREVTKIILNSLSQRELGNPVDYSVLEMTASNVLINAPNRADVEDGIIDILTGGNGVQINNTLRIIQLFPETPKSFEPTLLALSQKPEFQSMCLDALAMLPAWQMATTDRFVELTGSDNIDIAFQAAAILAVKLRDTQTWDLLLPYVTPDAIATDAGNKRRDKLIEAVLILKSLKESVKVPQVTQSIVALLDSDQPGLNKRMGTISISDRTLNVVLQRASLQPLRVPSRFKSLSLSQVLVETLRELGPEAAAALPTLKRLLKPALKQGELNPNNLQPSALQIATAIRAIEPKTSRQQEQNVVETTEDNVPATEPEQPQFSEPTDTPEKPASAAADNPFAEPAARPTNQPTYENQT
ncbi:MAG: hypothetical protein KDB23_31005, partial [Planctomycetales bacterium]|nr:hypothetical protein [Planctomycetales bacterium]